MTQADRQLPRCDETERFLLGAILAHTRDCESIFDLLRPEHFYVSMHRLIFHTMCILREQGQIVDLLGVHDALQRDQSMQDAGGVSFLAAFVDGIPQVAPLGQWAGRLRQYAHRRRVIYFAEQLQERAFEGEESVPDLLDHALERLSMMACSAGADDGCSYRDAAVRLLVELKEKNRPRIFTGIQGLDRIVGGFLPGELWTVAAPTGGGKSAFSQQVRRRACADGYHSLYVSGEMSATHLEARGLAALAAVPQGKMRRNDLITEEEFSCLADAAQKECEFCGIVDGVKRELDLRRIRLAALHMKSRSGLSLVVIDYDEMIDVDGEAGQQRKRTPRPLDEFERLRIVARAAKQIALQLECVVILVSQLRKPLTGEDAEFPTLQSVYGNQAKVKNATGVLLVHRPYVDNWTGEETDATLFVLKNRDGRRSKVPCTFDIAKLEFHDAARDAFSEADAKAEKK